MRLRGQRGAVDPDTGALDGDEHRNQRQFERRVDLVDLFFFQKIPKQRGELSRDIGALARIIDRRLDRHVGQRHGFGAPAAHILFRERLVAGVLEREILEPMLRSAGVDEIARQHRVGFDPAKRDAAPGQHDDVGLEVVP